MRANFYYPKLLLLCLPFLLVLSGCSERSRLLDLAREHELVREWDEDFWILNEYRHGVVCGKWDTERKFGNDRMGFRYFIIKDGQSTTLPNRDQWQIFCTDTPEVGLMKRLKIGPIEAEGGAVRKVYEDLVKITEALAAYRLDNADYPYTHQGLDLLLAGDGSQGYLDTLPEDPWGRPYRYEYSELGGMLATEYKLYTLGADGEPGGEAENAEISAKHLEYLHYVLIE